MADIDNTVTLENVKLVFRNFSGAEKQYNQAGARNFCVLLTDEMADGLSRDGWNVKTTREREGDDDEVLGGEPYLQVAVGYKGRPPNIVMLTSGGRSNLGEDLVGMLDYADIETCDLIIRPHDWNMPSGASGRKAYVKSLYVTIREDDLERKYRDVKPAGHAPVALDD